MGTVEKDMSDSAEGEYHSCPASMAIVFHEGLSIPKSAKKTCRTVDKYHLGKVTSVGEGASIIDSKDITIADKGKADSTVAAVAPVAPSSVIKLSSSLTTPASATEILTRTNPVVLSHIGTYEPPSVHPTASLT